MERELVMSRRIDCPHCGKRLNLPPKLVGKKVACPSCEYRFRYELDDEELTGHIEAAPVNPDLFPPNYDPTSQLDEEVVSCGGKCDGDDIKVHKIKNEPLTARFIERDASATKVKLGADGQLPNLELATQDKYDDTVNDNTGSNSWLLITVMCVSALLSILILLIDDPTSPHSSGEKDEVQQRVEAVYARLSQEIHESNVPLPRERSEPANEILDLLAKAIQAHNRGDNQLERSAYRQVLNVLNRENAIPYGGFSGEDNELKELLAKLLR